MAATVVQRTPVEIWREILDCVIYDRDLFELDIERPATFDAHSNALVKAVRLKVTTLHLVCKSWRVQLSEAYCFSSYRSPWAIYTRFVSHTHLIDYGQAPWNDLLATIGRRNLTYIDTFMPCDQSFADALLAALSKQPRFRYLILTFIFSTPATTFAPSQYSYPHLRTLSLKVPNGDLREPVSRVIQLDLPQLSDLFVMVAGRPGDPLPAIGQLVERIGQNVSAFSLEVWNSRGPLYFPPSMWTHLPKLETLRMSGHIMIQFPHPTLFPQVSSLYLPRALNMIIIANPSNFQLDSQKDFVAWVSDPEVREEGLLHLERLRLEKTWKAIGEGVDSKLAFTEFTNVLQTYDGLLKRAGMSLEDQDGIVLEDVGSYLRRVEEEYFETWIWREF